jgi:hypothetical protein
VLPAGDFENDPNASVAARVPQLRPAEAEALDRLADSDILAALRLLPEHQLHALAPGRGLAVTAS